jgi:hypothetical protein
MHRKNAVCILEETVHIFDKKKVCADEILKICASSLILSTYFIRVDFFLILT